MSKFTVAVKPTQGGDRFNVEVSSESSVSEFKEEVNRVREVPVAEQRIIYKGQVLKDERTVGSYGDHSVPAARRDLDLSVVYLTLAELCRYRKGPCSAYGAVSPPDSTLKVRFSPVAAHTTQLCDIRPS